MVISPRYVNGSAGEKERGLVMADYFEGRDWAKMAAGREFVFFQVGRMYVCVCMRVRMSVHACVCMCVVSECECVWE